MAYLRVPIFAVLLLAAGSARAQLTALGSQLLVDCTAIGSCAANESFGKAVAVGDFNNDGFADLAVGVVDKAVSGHPSAGSIHIFYGSRGGLQTTGDAIFTQNTLNVPGAAEDGDAFGFALAAGDFNGDGIDDLGVGAPNEDVGTTVDAGAVFVFFGSANGLTATGSLFFSQNTLPSAESAEASDYFGSSLAAGNAQGLGVDYLAIGVPGEDLGVFNTNEGVVEVLGSVNGEGLQSMEEIKQSDACGGPEAQDKFGYSVSYRPRSSGGGAFVIGAPYEDLGSAASAGAADVDFGCWTQASAGVPGTPETGDLFGWASATGDFNGDGRADVAIGAPGEAVSTTATAGAVNVLYADPSTGDITGTGSQFFSQNSFTNAVAGTDHLFGSALAVGDFDGDGFDDLAIGAPGAPVTGHADAGGLNVLYGTSGAGLGTSRNQTFNKEFPASIPGAAQTGAKFGVALAAGDFDGNGSVDLAIAAPNETVTASQQGAVTVLYGELGSIGALGTVQFSTNTITVSEATTATTHFFVLTRELSGVVDASIDYARTSGTATPGVDFTLNPGTKTWAAGSTSGKPVVFTVLPDTLAEGDETIVVKLSNPSDGTAIGTTNTLTIKIVDDDVGGAMNFHANFFSVSEAAGMATIQVDRTGGTASNVTVHYATINGSAIAGVDYTATSGTLTFAAGQPSATFQIPIFNDSSDEPDEAITLELSAPGGGGTLGAQTFATLTIVDDDPEGRIFADGFEGL